MPLAFGGCEDFLNPMWLQLQWCDRQNPLSIAMKEIFPVVLAAATFGHQWVGKVIQFVVDKMAVVGPQIVRTCI